MTTSNVKTFCSAFFMFGLVASVVVCRGNSWETWMFVTGLAATAVGLRNENFFKKSIPLLMNMQPFAAAVFAVSFVLSHLTEASFAICVVCAFVFAVIALSNLVAFWKDKPARRLKLLTGGAAVFGAGIPFLWMSCLTFILFAVASVAVRPAEKGREVTEPWKDFAFPVFVLLACLVVFSVFSHRADFSFDIAQAVAMFMIGCFIPTSASSGIRLSLMTFVLMFFSTYVYYCASM